MNLAILIPWRASDEHRRAAFEYTYCGWRTYLRDSYTGPLRVTIHVGCDESDAPFNFPRAINRARDSAPDADMLLVWGADHPPIPGVLDVIPGALAQHPWFGPFATTQELTEESTARVLAGGADPHDPDLPVGISYPDNHGLNACTAAAWDECPWDERFAGWGSSDTAWNNLLTARFGPQIQPRSGTVRMLWHPRPHQVDGTVELRATEYEGSREHILDVLPKVRAARQF